MGVADALSAPSDVDRGGGGWSAERRGVLSQAERGMSLLLLLWLLLWLY